MASIAPVGGTTTYQPTSTVNPVSPVAHKDKEHDHDKDDVAAAATTPPQSKPGFTTATRGQNLNIQV